MADLQDKVTPKVSGNQVVNPNARKPGAQVVEFMKDLGFELQVVTESIYRDKHDVPLWYFQTDSKNHTVDCSTVLASDASALWRTTQISTAFGTHCPHCKHMLRPKYKKRVAT